MIAESPTMVFRVLRDVRTPVRASKDDIITAWPGHPQLTLSVLDPEGKAILRSKSMDNDVLFPVLLKWYLDAKVYCIESSEQVLLCGGLPSRLKDE